MHGGGNVSSQFANRDIELRDHALVIILRISKRWAREMNTRDSCNVIKWITHLQSFGVSLRLLLISSPRRVIMHCRRHLRIHDSLKYATLREVQHGRH
jgi:hypothetical protein